MLSYSKVKLQLGQAASVKPKLVVPAGLDMPVLNRNEGTFAGLMAFGFIQPSRQHGSIPDSEYDSIENESEKRVSKKRR